MVVRDDGIDLWVVSEPLVLPAGGIALFAESWDPGLNGGIVPDAVYPRSDLILANDGDELILETAAGTLLDAVDWNTGFPEAAGASMALDLEHSDPDLNDDGANWCLGTTTFGAGDLGTPGGDNEPCGGDTFDGDGDGFYSFHDCDDTDPDTYPGASELCDGADNDCDAAIDEGC